MNFNLIGPDGDSSDNDNAFLIQAIEKLKQQVCLLQEHFEAKALELGSLEAQHDAKEKQLHAAEQRLDGFNQELEERISALTADLNKSNEDGMLMWSQLQDIQKDLEKSYLLSRSQAEMLKSYKNLTERAVYLMTKDL